MIKKIPPSLMLLLIMLAGESFALEKVKLQLRWHHGFQFAGYYMAEEKGFYANAGLDVDFVEGGLGINHLEEVLKGKAEFGIASTELLIEYLKGNPYRSMAAIFQHSPYALMVRKSSGYNNPQQLVGRSVYLPYTAEIQAMFVKEGVPLENLKIVDASKGLPDYTSSEIDAFAVYRTNIPFLLAEKGIETSFIRPVDYGIDFYGDILFSTSNYLASYSEQAQRFLNASLKGWQYAFENLAETLEILSVKYNSENRSIDHLRYEAGVTRELVMPDLIPIGQQNPFRWERIAQIYQELGFAPSTRDSFGFVYDPIKEELEWTRKYRQWVFYLSVAFGVVILVIFLWIIALRRAVAKRTMELLNETSEHKSTQLHLKKSEDKFKALFEVSPDAILLARRDTGMIVDANQSAEDLFETKLDNIIGKHQSELHPAQQKLPATESFKHQPTHPNEKAPPVEIDIVTPKQKNKTVEIIGKIIKLDDTEYVLGNFRDITVRKKNEQLLRESEEKYRQLFEIAQEGIWVIDANSNTTMVNPSMANLLGYTPEEMVGKQLFGFMDEAGKTIAEENIKRRQDGIIEQHDFEFLHKNGTKIYTTIETAPIQGNDGEYLGAIAGVIDVTKRKIADEQVKSALKEKETLLYEIHHRVKNNMQVIASLLRLQLNNKGKKDVDAILKENISRVYSMAAIHESLHQSEKLSEIDFKAYLHKLSQMLSQTYSIAPGKVTYQIDIPDLNLAIDNANPLGLALNELISNSLKYAFPDDQKGTISIKSGFLDEETIELIVADDGIGLPDGFEWKNSDSLGLKLVQNLVENQLGGSIDLDNSSGTKFTIKFNLESNYK